MLGMEVMTHIRSIIFSIKERLSIEVYVGQINQYPVFVHLQTSYHVKRVSPIKLNHLFWSLQPETSQLKFFFLFAIVSLLISCVQTLLSYK